MLQVTLDITLSLEGPILTKSSTPGHYGIDAAMAVDHKGRYYIPGSLIKGRLRQSWEELNDAASYIQDKDIEDLLGKRSDKEEAAKPAVEPRRGLLVFSDFTSGKKGTHVLHRIRMDEETGAVAEGALLVMETPFAPGEKACFHGTINYLVTDETRAAKIRDLIEKGLQWTIGLGSHRTVGFGKLLNVAVNQTIKQLQMDIEPVGALQEYNETIGLVIQPRAPFCIAKRRVSNNLFESETIIPGNIIKGAIASMWGQILGPGAGIEITEGIDPQRTELCRYFEKIRFRHALPAESTRFVRSVTPPLSLCKAGKGKDIYDVVMIDEPVLIEGQAPEFDVDWKDRSDVDMDFGWASPPMELRVRTAIDRSRRKAKENQLFAYEMVIPDGHHWLSWIDLGMVPEKDRSNVLKQLSGLLAFGLNGWGKTKVSADVALKDMTSIQPRYESELAPLNGQYIITLQTPALLCDPDDLNETSGQTELFNAYQAVWKQLSNGSLTLVRYFARQSLAGGYYLYRRFQPGKEYKPYLLTEGGSIFVLEIESGKESEASENIAAWYTYGLPLPEWAVTRYSRGDKKGDHWTNCPYVRENGYGEIAVNMSDVHIRKKPPEARYKEVRDAV